MDSIFVWADFVSAVFAIVLPLLVLAVAWLAGRISGPERFFTLAALRRTRSVAAKENRQLPKARVRALADVVRDQVLLRLRGIEIPVAEVVAARVLQNRAREDALEDLRVLREVCAGASSPGRQSAVARLAWPESLDIARTVAQEFMSYIEDTFLHTARPAPSHEDDPLRFADVVSLFTGAVVFADGQQSRAGVIEQVHIVNRDLWDGPSPPHPQARQFADEPVRVGRLRIHRPTSAYETFHSQADIQRVTVADGAPLDSGLRPGDYDGRIFSLRGVETLIDSRTGGIVVMVETHDACYSVSERVPGARCKHLPSRFDLAGHEETPTFVQRADGAFARTDSDQVVLLNTILGVLTHAEGETTLVLSRRTNRANNAHDVLSATSGGVFENRRGAGHHDSDELGTPDPLGSCLRETREELGIDIPHERVAAQAVFLANVQGRPNPRGERENGQLVATVCFLTEIGLSIDELRRERALNADWGQGRFEMDELVPIALPTPSGPTETERRDAADRFFAEVKERIHELDQNAMICALYAATHVYGREITMASLSATFERPWWDFAWSGDTAEAPRIVRNPALLYGDLGPRILGAHTSWAAHVAGLSADPHSEVGAVVE